MGFFETLAEAVRQIQAQAESTLKQPNPLGLLTQASATASQAVTTQGRAAALKAARALVNALEAPEEKIVRISWGEPMLFLATRLGIDLKLFAKLQEATSPDCTCDELAKETGCDEVLLSRLLKHLATGAIVKETAVDRYAATPTSNLLATPEGAGPVVNCFSSLGKVESNVVEYFQKRDWKNPTDKDDSPFKYGAKTDLHYFQWVFQPDNQEEAGAFLNHMKLLSSGPRWYDTVPVEEIFGTSCGPSDVLLVDVGGNAGHDITKFHQANPNLQGKLILEDLPQTIESIDAKAIAPVEPLAHDFFTEQPVKGAKAYYLKMILHDWPDSACHDILSNLKPALKAGYSKILINETVIPDKGAEWYATGLDLLMMVTHSAHERREREWKALVKGAGLKVVKIWDCGAAPEKLIEVELA
ncbi:hypothetical protein LTR78_001075 [Recurvomyces mirabilis]|uniref:O-methyltransferase domain-containing protein n=1 Tax=Recurvomyces mirabilis TaxID=574656 RepID=A0AAE0WX59_9PEZI|nr:hypothetical protein LTR78_001075 [Recurvomyces mirabilis]KAK5159047.1 hypothetical protein LTS14_003155 [Recurvomyces mirabilis]